MTSRDVLNDELEDFEFEDRTFNMYEYYYNVIIAYIMVTTLIYAFSWKSMIKHSNFSDPC